MRFNTWEEYQNYKDKREFKGYSYAVILTIIFFWIPIILFIGSCDKALSYEIDMDIISKIESSNNPLAYNKRSKATGLYQITPICLADYKIYHNDDLVLKDMFVPKKGYSVAYWYLHKRIPQLLKHYGKDDTLENRLISYNCGIKCVGNPLPKETKNYIIKYKKG